MITRAFTSDHLSPARCRPALRAAMLLAACWLCLAPCWADEPQGARPPHPLVPSLVTVQYAGNIGTVSIGPGWDYGRHERWQTHLLLGYLPKEVMRDNYFCLTLRQNYSPWQVAVGAHSRIVPAVFGVSLNTLFSGEFWYREPDENYYNFSTKLRFHLAVGSRYDLHLPRWADTKQPAGTASARRLSVYYELSTYDLAVLSSVRSSAIHLADILTLGIGLQYKFF